MASNDHYLFRKKAFMSNESSPGGSQTSLTNVEECKSNALSMPNIKVLETNGQIRELQTIIRDKNTSRSDFVFYSNRLIRLVVEEGLNCLPSFKQVITTPTGFEYEGEWFEKNNCAVSILRNGEAMEKGLRECCRSMRIGKILIRKDQDTKKPKVYYSKFPPSIEKRKILLLHPTLESGATAMAAVGVLKEHGASEQNIVLVTLFSTPRGALNCLQKFPNMIMMTSELHEVCPSHFGRKYFGSDV